MESKHKTKVETCLPGARQWGKRERLVKGYRLSVLRWVISEDLMYNVSHSQVTRACLCAVSFIILQLRRYPRNVEEETKYIELMIVNDHLMVGFAEFCVV